MIRALGSIVVVAVLSGVSPAVSPADELVLESARFRAVLGSDAVWRSLRDRATGRQLCSPQPGLSCAAVRLGERWHAADRARWEDGRLQLEFAGCDTRLVYGVTTTDDWIALRLEQIAGTRPAHVSVLRIATAITDRGGSRLNAAWNDRLAVCLRATSLQSDGSLRRGNQQTVLSINSQDEPGPRLEGSGAALIVAAPAELPAILGRLARQFDLPRNEQDGIASRDLPLARQSYWFLSFAERDVDRVIDYCRRTGIRQVMLDSGSWCQSVGHFTFNLQRYPDGLESLRRTVARLHREGILVGMHTFASKVSKHDPHVTPIPDRGFWVDRTARLAGGIDRAQTEIRTESDLSQWPGSPVAQQKVWEGHVSLHQEVIINDEIIRYRSIGPEGRWDTFQGCERGAWGTVPAEHAAAAECRHYAVDGCINGYILDQEAPLFQQTTSRLAEIFNACDFDMVYFDGSEDVDRRRYHYYSANAHAVAMAKFTKRPLIHMGGGFTHGLWHSYTRSATVDQYPGTYLAYLRAGGTIEQWPSCKEHIDRSVRNVIACHEELTPGELGWFGIGPKDGGYAGLQFDEIEYLMCKSLAYDAPISLQTSFARLAAHPLTDDLLEIVRQYEQLRGEGRADAEQLQQLRQQGQDFVLLPSRLQEAGAGGPAFAAVAPVEAAGGSGEVRALLGGWGDGSVATVWHETGRVGSLQLAAEVVVYDVRGTRLEVVSQAGRVQLPLDQRRLLLHFPDRSPEQVRQLLAGARLEIRPPAVLWLQAEQPIATSGQMLLGSQAEIEDDGALGDVVLCDGRIDAGGDSWSEYRVDIPHRGRWTLWARVRYPTGGDMSFGLGLPGHGTAEDRQVLGNCGVNSERWHWTGRGGGISSVPPGSPIVLDLDAGPLVFRIYPREGPGSRAGNPRLDCFCLAEDPEYRPDDRSAGAALAR